MEPEPQARTTKRRSKYAALFKAIGNLDFDASLLVKVKSAKELGAIRTSISYFSRHTPYAIKTRVTSAGLRISKERPVIYFS